MTLIAGMMKSGKSSLLLKTAKEFIKNDKPYIIIRPQCDNRNFFSRNDDETIQLNFGNENTDLKDYKHIIIDEIHLYDKSFIERILKLKDKEIILSGLMLDIENNIFDYFSLVFPYLKEIKILKSKCDKCAKEATHYKRIGEQIIGDNYIVLCKECFV